MRWARFLRALGSTLALSLLLGCVAVVPPWELRSLWGETDGSEHVGLVGMGNIIVLAAIFCSVRESRHP